MQVFKYIKFLYWKWIKKRCPHFCALCLWKTKECFEEFKETGKL